MQGFFNYANRQLCEFQSIFPTPASLMNHVLFTNGTECDVDQKTGRIKVMGVFLESFPDMNDDDWQALIADCYAKERRWAEKYAYGRSINEEELTADCAKYQRSSLGAEAFEEEVMYQSLRTQADAKKQDYLLHDMVESFVRPYPLSQGYANVFHLNKKTPQWFLQIAYNTCRAWERHLTDEINNYNFWVKPSLRPKRANHEAIAEGMKELVDKIKADVDYDGWLDKPEPTSDYADSTWTSRTRDTIAAQAKRLGKLLK